MCWKKFKPTWKKTILFLILLVIGIGILTGPSLNYIPPSPGHERTIGLFNVVIWDTSYFASDLFFYFGVFLTVISLIFLIIFCLQKTRGIK